jgi:transposase-like protein
MRYSEGLKKTVVRRMLPPESRTAAELSAEYGMSENTIYAWKKSVIAGTIESDGSQLPPRERSAAEKLKTVLESKRVPEEQYGEWLRSMGLHSEHIPLWEQELETIVSEKQEKQARESKASAKRVRELERELARKEKALAEMAALLTLKKKAEALWGESEDD